MNYLFGYDYILWSNSAANGMARVFKLKDGRVVYWRYRITKVMDEVKSPDQVFWLTCHPDKYLKQIHDRL